MHQRMKTDHCSIANIPKLWDFDPFCNHHPRSNKVRPNEGRGGTTDSLYLSAITPFKHTVSDKAELTGVGIRPEWSNDVVRG